jgi:tetratricopeptide (TPR) repeat protein
VDQLKTKSNELDVWHAMQLLEKANGAELKTRLAAMSERVKTPLPPSPATDQIYRTLALESVRLANDRLDEPDEARALVASADTYLSRMSTDSETTPENDEVRSAMQKIQIALGDIPDPEKEVKAPVANSPSPQLSRLLKEGNAAFEGGRYAKAADLAQQVIAKGQGKRELAALVDQAKALLKKAETSQEEFEKVNIQNR